MKRSLFLLFILLMPATIFGLSFGPFFQISPGGGNGVPPLLAVSSNGNAFAAWVNFPNNIQVAYFTASTNTWVSANFTLGSAPQIGIDGSGNAFIVWVAQTGPSTQIFTSRFTPATKTTPALTTQLSIVGTFNSSPQIAVGSSGVAIVTWSQTAPFQVLSKSFNPKTVSWSAAPVIVPFLPASTALDGFGKGFAIITSFSGAVQGAVQVSRIIAP